MVTLKRLCKQRHGLTRTDDQLPMLLGQPSAAPPLRATCPAWRPGSPAPMLSLAGMWGRAVPLPAVVQELGLADG